MKIQALAFFNLFLAASAAEECLNLAVNFAFGGAQTDGSNRALSCLGGLLRRCDDVEANKEDLERAGLVVPGLVQQIDYAVESLTDEHKNKDIFMLYAGGECPSFDTPKTFSCLHFS